jgi:methylthioribulose-1-phosphate dehydratase
MKAPAFSSIEPLAAALISSGESFDQRGWALGASGNFSAVIARAPLQILITPSGASKGALRVEDLIVVDETIRVVQGDRKPSAEGQLHAAIYRARPDAAAVLHSHSVWATLLSEWFAAQRGLELCGFEMLKGLNGVSSHEHSERVPILENSQDYMSLGRSVSELLLSEPRIHGFVLRRHGLYTWGTISPRLAATWKFLNFCSR